jgi:hypothetical protein
MTPKMRKFLWAMYFNTGEDKFKYAAFKKGVSMPARTIAARPYMAPAIEEVQKNYGEILRDRLLLAGLIDASDYVQALRMRTELVAAVVSSAGKREAAAAAAAASAATAALATTTATPPSGKDSLALSSLLTRVAELEAAALELSSDLAAVAAAPDELAARLDDFCAAVVNVGESFSRTVGAYAALFGVVSTADVASAISETTTTAETVARNAAALEETVARYAASYAAEALIDYPFDSVDEAQAIKADWIDALTGLLGSELLDDPDTLDAARDLRDAVARWIDEQASTLPDLREVSPAWLLSSLELAHELYGDASRADEIEGLNDVLQPGFIAATTLRVLSQ